jgi:hypothetical protein
LREFIEAGTVEPISLVHRRRGKAA